MVIITGGSGGIGQFLCEQLSRTFPVIATYHSRKPTAAINGVTWHQLDVTDSRSVARFAEATRAECNHVVLINSAGTSLDAMGHKMNEDDWDRVLDTNLTGTFLMCRAFLPFMRNQSWGRIINLSSIVAQMGIPGTAAYSASKSGLFGLTRTLAAENASKNITVNALALGYFDAGLIGALSPEMQESVKAKIPMKRFGHPDNIEAAIRFLISSDYTTGTVININGGLY